MVHVRFILLALAAVLVLASAKMDLEQSAEHFIEDFEMSPFNTKLSSSLVDRVLKLLEDFRGIMKTGRSDMNIPVLDPAVVEKLPINVDLAPFDFEAISTDVHVSGVSAFKITKMTQVQGTNQLSVAIEVPEVDVSGHYEINGKVKIGFFDVSLNGGKGPFSLKMKGFKGTSNVDMILNSDGSLNMNSIKFESWSFDKIEAKVDNMFMGNVIIPLINKLTPVFLKLNQGWINKWGENVAMIVTNRYLDGIAGKNTLMPSDRTEAVEGSPIDPMVVSPDVQEILDQLAMIVMAPRARQAALIGA